MKDIFKFVSDISWYTNGTSVWNRYLNRQIERILEILFGNVSKVTTLHPSWVYK